MSDCKWPECGCYAIQGPGWCRVHAATPSAVDAAPVAPSDSLHYLIDKAIIAARRDQRDLTPESMAAAAEARNKAIAAARSPSPALTAAGGDDLIQRIDAAIQRCVDGNATMRIPADLTDPDLVLADCKRVILATRSTQAVVPAPAADERERFEECARDAGWHLARFPVSGDYNNSIVQARWEGWQARAALSTPAADDARDAAGWWQPIETAPKDGTPILITNGKDVTVGHWLHQEPYIREHRDLEGRYIGQDESDGFDGWIDWAGGIPGPTHWMPLPKPPDAALASREQQEGKP